MQLPSLQQFTPNVKKPAFDDQALRGVVKGMLEASEETVGKVIDELKQTSKEKLGDQAYMLDLFPRLEDQYGKTDNGNLVAV